MEYENEMEEIIQDVVPDVLESEEIVEIPETDTIPDPETPEEIQTPSDPVSENETAGDLSLTEETTPDETDQNETDQSDADPGETDQDENGSEEADLTETGSEETSPGTISGNSVEGESPSSGDTYYVTNIYEIVEETEVPLWDSSFRDMSAEVLLLCLIFFLLLAQFLHSFFKGSHWFK